MAAISVSLNHLPGTCLSCISYKDTYFLQYENSMVKAGNANQWTHKCKMESVHHLQIELDKTTKWN